MSVAWGLPRKRPLQALDDVVRAIHAHVNSRPSDAQPTEDIYGQFQGTPVTARVYSSAYEVRIKLFGDIDNDGNCLHV